MKKRNVTLDVLRGIATILVVLGHSIQRGMVTGYEQNALFKIIYTVHMPLFVVLSGYTLAMTGKKIKWDYLFGRIRRLIYPTILWTILLFFVAPLPFTGLRPFF